MTAVLALGSAPWVGLVSALALALYGFGSLRVRRWPVWRSACFAAGVAALFAALGTGLAETALGSLSAHMVEHLLIGLVAPPLIWLGAPAELALRALRPRPRRRLARFLSSGSLRWIAQPVVGLALITVVMLGAHVPTFWDLTLRNKAVHEAEHAAFLLAGLVFWAPLLGPPMLRRLRGPLPVVLYLTLSMLPMALLGAWLISRDHVIYPANAPAGRTAALDDQDKAGLIMLGGGNIVIGGALVALGWGAVVREERQQQRREAAAKRAAQAGTLGRTA
jgi:cytochrome c oxidase assembly factor CtaG